MIPKDPSATAQLTRHHQLVFIAGLHRSGTSLLHQIIRAHPQISGFENVHDLEDEGQHLQSVYPSGLEFGGPGRFAFDPMAYMDEAHPLATPENAAKLFGQWSQYWDLGLPVLIEKSPPNIIRARFLQKLFPGAHFIHLIRNPVAVACATTKWAEKSLEKLLDHSLHANEVFVRDCDHLDSVHRVHYEHLVECSLGSMNRLYEFLNLPAAAIEQEIKPGLNDRYFDTWEDAQNDIGAIGKARIEAFEKRANRLGYSIKNCRRAPAYPA